MSAKSSVGVLNVGYTVPGPANSSRLRLRTPSPVNRTRSERALEARALGFKQVLVEAIEQVSMGDEAAFELVYAATSAKLYGIIIRIVGRPDAADDVLQEVFIRVWQRAVEFDPTCASPITWLATIARNRALDEVKRKPMRSFEDCPEIFQVPNGDDPLADYEQGEDRRRVLASLDLLGPKRKEVLLQAYYYGMTREEIARRVGRPVSTVKTWLRRSLAELKGHLAQ